MGGGGGFAVLVDRGEDAEFLFEVFAEDLGIVEACLIGYLGDVELTLAEELGGSLQAHDADELYGGLSGDLLELLV